MSKIDDLYNSLATEQQSRITRQQFLNGILHLEMEKLRDMGLFKNLSLTFEDARDIIYNKLINNYNNIVPDGSHRCMHNYCRNKDIKASHVLPAAGLRMIAGKSGKKNNVLYTPLADLNLEQLKIITLGINKAFRFPGFCEKHENWFDFERKIEITSNEEAYKQIFRSICYDQYLKELFMEQDKLLVNLALGKVKEKAEGIFAEHTILDIELKSYHNAETKNMLKRLKRSTRRGKLLLKEFKEFKKNVWKAIRKDKSEVFLWQGEAKSRIPVALTHCGYIHITNLGKTYRVFAAIVIMPVAAGSIILICSPAKFKRQINYIIGSFRQKGYLDHFIFSTLASLTDNWLVNPEFWDNDLAEDAIKELLGKRNWEQPD